MNVALVVPDVWCIDLGLVNVYLCADGDRLTLIDAGLATSAGNIAAAIIETGHHIEQLAQIVLTHFHDDHSGAASTFRLPPAVRVLAHAADVEVVRGLAPQPEIDLNDEERDWFEKNVPDVPPASPCDVDRELCEGDAITMAGDAVVVGVPGYTPGSIALYAPARGLLFTGDAFASFNPRPIVDPFNIDRAAARASFLKLARLDFDVVCPGHSAPITGDAARSIRAAAERIESPR